MCGEPSKERLRARVAKTKIGDGVRRRYPSNPKTREQKRVARQNMHWRQNFRRKRVPLARKRFEKSPPRITVAAKRLFHVREITIEKNRGSIIKRMRQNGWRVKPLEPVIAKRKHPKKRRANSERMNRRTEIVPKTRQRQLERSRSPTRLRLGVEHVNAQSRLRENDRGRKPVGPSADHGGTTTRIFGSISQRRSPGQITCSFTLAEPPPTATPAR